MIMPAKIENLLDDFRGSDTGTVVRRVRPISQASKSVGLVTPTPLVKDFATDAIMSARLGHIASSRGVFEHFETPVLSTVLLLLGHEVSLK